MITGQIEPVMENYHVKLLCDFNIYNRQNIEARKPDLILTDKITDEGKIIDVPVLGDIRVVEKEVKIEKWRYLAIEIGRLWKKNVNTVPIVIRVLGTTSKSHLHANVFNHYHRIKML